MNETQQKIYTQAKGKWDAIAKPIDSLGVFEDMVARLCAIAGTVNPGDYKRRALLTLCADHGVVAEGVTQTDASVTKVVAVSIIWRRWQAWMCMPSISVCGEKHIRMRHSVWDI